MKLEKLIAQRIAPVELGRRMGVAGCRKCGAIYNLTFKPPKQPGICDICGGELYQRDDDKSETVVRRIQVYLTQTAPLIAYYRQRGLLNEIDGSQAIDKVTDELLAVVEKQA